MLANFLSKCLDKIVFGKEVRSTTNEGAQVEHDVTNQEVVMLIKLSMN